MNESVLSPFFVGRLVVVAGFVGSFLYVHFRGRERLRFARQLTDHSTFTAPYNVLVYFFSAVARKPILDVRDFPELARLRENWQTIRDEAMHLNEAGHIRASEHYDDVGFNTFFRKGWKRFYLKWYGEPLPSASRLCPKTVELLESIPTVNGALFALLGPRSRVGNHRDPFAGSLRYHLGLVTPNSDACRIFIDGMPYSWRDGQDIVFDETYVHRFENDTDEARIILFCDFERPIRNPVVRTLNRFVARKIVRLTATRNEEGEPVGFANRVFGIVYLARDPLRRLKHANRRLYYFLKYAMLAAVVYLALFAGLQYLR